MPDAGISRAISGDIAFLLKHEFLGNLKKNEGALSGATGDLATLTASASKDLYLSKAKCIFTINDVSSAFATSDEVVLKVNGTIIETAKISYGIGASSDAGIMAIVYEFKNIGYKVDATEIIKLEGVTVDSQTDIEGFIQCIEVDDGIDPTVV